MRTDGLFGFTVTHIPVKYNEPIRIIPIGDVHYNSPAFARDRWDEDRERWAKYCRQKGTYFLFTGDMFEAMSTSERQHYVQEGYHDSNKTRWEREYAREIDAFIKECPFLIGRTLAVFGGNHYFSFFDGTTSDMALASKVKAPYVGGCGYLGVNLDIGGRKSHTLRIFVHHGIGGARTAGSSFNSLEMAAGYFPDANVVLMGHNHKAGAITLPSLNFDHGMGGKWRIKAFDRIIARTGSYLKSYEAGTKNYAHDALYRPSTLGGIELLVTVARTQENCGGKRREDCAIIKVKAVL